MFIEQTVGFHERDPNQWFRSVFYWGFGPIFNMSFRFITPIFLHAGFIHILLNIFAQLTLSAQVCFTLHSLLSGHHVLQIEREMGSGGFFITYFAAGIFGCVECVMLDYVL